MKEDNKNGLCITIDFTVKIYAAAISLISSQVNLKSESFIKAKVALTAPYKSYGYIKRM